jgi:hypothetical protein
MKKAMGGTAARKCLLTTVATAQQRQARTSRRLGAKPSG